MRMKTTGITITAVTAISLFAGACATKRVAVNRQTQETTTTSQPVAENRIPPAPPVREPERPAAVAPASRYPDAATRARIDELIGHIQDAYFDYNQHTLRPDAVQALNTDSKELATIMTQYPDYKLKIEGYCDERGSAEFNLALGDARAHAAKDYLVSVGVSANQLDTVSYGKEAPICTEHDESCWQKNRRIHITAQKSNS
jgi:peptidoglycan-associated lipoprotein